jgi:hypothetical protein
VVVPNRKAGRTSRAGPQNARQLTGRTHHLLLVTATPAPGKEHFFRALLHPPRRGLARRLDGEHTLPQPTAQAASPRSSDDTHDAERFDVRSRCTPHASCTKGERRSLGSYALERWHGRLSATWLVSVEAFEAGRPLAVEGPYLPNMSVRVS